MTNFVSWVEHDQICDVEIYFTAVGDYTGVRIDWK